MPIMWGIMQTIRNKTDKNSCPSGVDILMGGEIQWKNLDNVFEGGSVLWKK